ncbi:MAG: hypothetical protein B7Z66_15590 [Chromatiales bacterium 21-64-14]|nr:MAG: hypothetical protein B7Z66_15590 [Chromatiales bacterium 21-64-14]
MSLSWSDVGKAIAGIAPVLGTALGGPAGAVVGGLVASALGTNNDPVSVNSAIAADPANAAKILALQAQHEENLRKMNLDYETALVTAQAGTIQAEAKSDSWLAANWRPILMLTFTFIVAVNYAFLPMAGWFGVHAAALALPPDMWDLLKIGIGGYIVGRSGEKITRNLKQ